MKTLEPNGGSGDFEALLSSLGIGVYRQPQTVEGERALREQVLDRIHATLEGAQRRKEPVVVGVCTREGQLITYRIDSLKMRKRKTPSERERRRLLGLQLADFLTAAGL